MFYIPHFLEPWTPNITLGLDPIILSSPLRIARLLNVILLPECFLKTFIDIFDIMFLSLLFLCIDIPI